MIYPDNIIIQHEAHGFTVVEVDETGTVIKLLREDIPSLDDAILARRFYRAMFSEETT